MSSPPHQDPFAQREAAKYEQPIASREFILQCFGRAQGPLLFEQLAESLEYREPREREALQRRLRAMVRDGQLLANRRGRYVVVAQADLVAGAVIAHPDGFGFLRPDAPAGEAGRAGKDLYLSAKQMRTLMHGDRAIVRRAGAESRERPEAKLVEILARGARQLCGRYFQEAGLGFVRPENRRYTQDVLVPPGGEAGARHGDIVTAQITAYPTKQSHALGRITEILGRARDTEMHIALAIRKFELPHAWPAAVTAELDGLRETLPAAEVARRRDIRDLGLVTIDGEDARDFDDAVYCRPNSQGWKLYVAIADVAWYVRPDTELDREAAARGTSVYFPTRVLPMLPEVLSNGLCSLNPEVDRFCLLCEMDIDRHGELVHSRFDAAVMRSAARLTYGEAAAVLTDAAAAGRAPHAGLAPCLRDLHGLYKTLAQARRRRGAIEFESIETRFVFDRAGKVTGIETITRNDAHKIIEECMLMANTAAARYLERHNMPALYRVHGGPKADDLAALRAFLSQLGLALGGGEKPRPKDYNQLLAESKHRPDAHVIQTVMLRSLKQAVYQPDNRGHFGLSLESYTHFTSPIRRYPDLLAHRAIRHVMAGAGNEGYLHNGGEMEQLGAACSAHERRADEAGWDVAEALKCEYLQDHVEAEFAGVVAGVQNFGLFVDLDHLGISGLAHITTLGDDYFHHDPLRHQLVGEHTGVVFKLGMPMRVRLARVDVDERKIDLQPLDLPPALGHGRARPNKGRVGRRNGARGRRRWG